MIIKRVLSILFDFFSSFLPAIAVNYAGGNLVFSFLFFFIITQIGELFLETSEILLESKVIIY